MNKIKAFFQRLLKEGLLKKRLLKKPLLKKTLLQSRSLKKTLLPKESDLKTRGRAHERAHERADEGERVSGRMSGRARERERESERERERRPGRERDRAQAQAQVQAQARGRGLGLELEQGAAGSQKKHKISDTIVFKKKGQDQQGIKETLRVIKGKDKGREFLLIPSAMKIGRQIDNYISLTDPKVSREHALLKYISEKNQFYLQDLGSTNGTYLNGHRIIKMERVKPGETINVGDTVLQLVSSDLRK